MAAPTPVSALLHAATMITAGIFTLFRFWFIIIWHTICSIGCFTSMFGAVVACTQSDMKKVIAYSTTSQLGILCWSCGIANYFGALFHLLVHAFFKSLLFLTAGGYLHSELTIYKLGGFTTNLPLSYSYILICVVSLIGWPKLSGSFSKSNILSSSYYGWSDLFSYYLSTLAIHVTVYYSSKLIISQFVKPLITICNTYCKTLLLLAKLCLFVAFIFDLDYFYESIFHFS